MEVKGQTGLKKIFFLLFPLPAWSYLERKKSVKQQINLVWPNDEIRLPEGASIRYMQVGGTPMLSFATRRTRGAYPIASRTRKKDRVCYKYYYHACKAAIVADLQYQFIIGAHCYNS